MAKHQLVPQQDNIEDIINGYKRKNAEATYAVVRKVMLISGALVVASASFAGAIHAMQKYGILTVVN